MVNFYIKSIIIAGSEITVDYEIILSNEEFQGAIGGGRTVLPLASVEASIDSLKIDIESYIEKYVGIDLETVYRASDEMGSMYFTRTLEDWARFDISSRTKFDASISSGLAIMANQKNVYLPEKKQSKISLNFATYNNKGILSELIR